MMSKAYQRRGYAYEHLEKFSEAKQDFLRVKELQPNSAEATKAIARMNKAMQESNRVDLGDVEIKVNAIKEAGNALFQKQKYTEAIAKFSEGVEIYMKDQATMVRDKDIKLKITQILTNRSLSYNLLGN